MRAFVLSGLLLFGTAAIAAETITYTYDARGRLISVVHSGGPSNGLTTTYSLDDADNRTGKTTSSGGGGTTCSGVSFAVGNASATEGSNLSFTVTKSGTTSDSCTVNYATANNSAVAPGDYTSTSGTLTFTSAQSSKRVSVTTVDDTLVESSESMYLNLSNPSGSATISDAQGVGTINDNDSANPCTGVSFTIASNAAVTEGTNSVFTITKTGSTSNSCSVDYATANGSAGAPGDYTAASGTRTFTAAQTSQTVSVTTVDDSTVESAETFTMSLSNPTGGSTVGTPGSATATINDNDSAPNQPPVANFDNAGSMSCGDSITFNVVANDTDPDGNYPLSLVSASGSAGLSVSVENSTDLRLIGITSGAKTFSYVVQDSLGAQDTGSGSVTVTAPCQ